VQLGVECDQVQSGKGRAHVRDWKYTPYTGLHPQKVATSCTFDSQNQAMNTILPLGNAAISLKLAMNAKMVDYFKVSLIYNGIRSVHVAQMETGEQGCRDTRSD
jgi:hypothetical protein